MSIWYEWIKENYKRDLAEEGVKIPGVPQFMGFLQGKMDENPAPEHLQRALKKTKPVFKAMVDGEWTLNWHAPGAILEYFGKGRIAAGQGPRPKGPAPSP